MDGIFETLEEAQAAYTNELTRANESALEVEALKEELRAARDALTAVQEEMNAVKKMNYQLATRVTAKEVVEDAEMVINNMFGGGAK